MKSGWEEYISIEIKGGFMDALEKLIVLVKDAWGFGFGWPNQQMIIDQIVNECKEINDDIAAQESPEKIQEEIGDLLHAAISLCIFSGFSVEETLEKVNQKFTGRMSALKTLTKDCELQNLQGQSINFMLELWKKAKNMTDMKK